MITRGAHDVSGKNHAVGGELHPVGDCRWGADGAMLADARMIFATCRPAHHGGRQRLLRGACALIPICRMRTLPLAA